MCLCLLMWLPGCVGKWGAREPQALDVASVVQAVELPLIECNDKAMAPCPGVDEPLDNAQDLANAASVALERLEVCQTKHHAEVVRCVQDFRGVQIERRQRLQEQGQ